MPSEFAAYLGELRQIRKFRPYFNHRGNVTRRTVLIKISSEPAPRVYAGGTVARDDVRCYGPFRSMARTLEAVRTLNDLLGLRDCAADDAGGLRRPGGSLRPAAAGRMHAPRVRLLQRAVRRLRDRSGIIGGGWRPPMAFLEGRTIQPIDRVVAGDAGAPRRRREFEVAARWREKFEQLEWLLAATSRARTAPRPAHLRLPRPGRFRRRPRVPRAPGRRARLVSLSHDTPIEHEAFRAVVAEEAARPAPPVGPLPLDSIDEILLLMAWFRAHPEALRRTTPYAQWAA